MSTTYCKIFWSAEDILIEFKKYEDERTTILLTYIQSCPLLTSYNYLP